MALIALIGLTVFMIGRRKEKIREVEENLDNVMDWIEEMVDETRPTKPDLPPEPLPEEEELRAWARGEREVSDWQDRIPDDNILELE